MNTSKERKNKTKKEITPVPLFESRMADLFFETVTHGDLDHVKVALQYIMAADAAVLEGRPADEGGRAGRVALLLTHFERTNLFAANGVLFEFALWRGSTDILTFLTAHFVAHFSDRLAGNNSDDYCFDDDDDVKPIPPTTYARMRCNFNNALFNWRTAASSTNVKTIVDAFSAYFADEEGPADVQVFSQVLSPTHTPSAPKFMATRSSEGTANRLSGLSSVDGSVDSCDDLLPPDHRLSPVCEVVLLSSTPPSPLVGPVCLGIPTS